MPGQRGDLKLIKPNTLVVVPLVLERFQKEIYAKLNKVSPLAAPLFTYFMEYKKRWTRRGFDTPLLNRIVCSRINAEFGGRLNWIGSGGAALHAQIQSFSKSALNVSLLNGNAWLAFCRDSYLHRLYFLPKVTVQRKPAAVCTA